MAVLTGCKTVPYKETVSKWDSHDDVGKWLQNNFVFDTNRQRTISQRLKNQGPDGLLVRNPRKLYENSTGYCVDSANFALHHLNEIDPEYNARWVFVENALGRPNHWVTAFDYQGKLYVMDYGAGDKWVGMQGTHGPYSNLEEYRDFLASLSLPNFGVGNVYYREMPGQED